jgi:type IV secretory pathway VirB6-like protein
MKNILTFVFIIIAGQFIKDNLPNMHYKNIIAAFEKYVMPFLFIAFIGLLMGIAKISGNKQLQQNLTYTLTLLVVTILLTKAYEVHKNELVKNL